MLLAIASSAALDAQYGPLSGMPSTAETELINTTRPGDPAPHSALLHERLGCIHLDPLSRHVVPTCVCCVGAQERQESLGDDKRADSVDVHHGADLLHGDQGTWGYCSHASAVDHTEQPTASQLRADQGDSSFHSWLVRDVEDEGLKAGGRQCSREPALGPAHAAQRYTTKRGTL